MANIPFNNGTVRDQSLTSESMLKVWVSPNDANSADTVQLPVIKNRTLRTVSCVRQDTGAHVTAPIDSNGIATLDVGGSATSKEFVLTYLYK